jgi:hypothetical protein
LATVPSGSQSQPYADFFLEQKLQLTEKTVLGARTTIGSIHHLTLGHEPFAAKLLFKELSGIISLMDSSLFFTKILMTYLRNPTLEASPFQDPRTTNYVTWDNFNKPKKTRPVTIVLPSGTSFFLWLGFSFSLFSLLTTITLVPSSDGQTMQPVEPVMNDDFESTLVLVLGIIVVVFFVIFKLIFGF